MAPSAPRGEPRPSRGATAGDDGHVISDGASILPIVVLVLAAAAWGWCLADVARTDERDVRTYPKQVWLVIVCFGSVVGGLYWLAAGRPLRPR